MPKGYLITFEGGECAGKGTQTKLLEQFLTSKNYTVNNTLWEPGSTPKSELLRIVVKNKFDTNFEFPNGFLQTFDFNKYKAFFSQDQLSTISERYLKRALELSNNLLKNEVIKFVLRGETKTQLMKRHLQEFINFEQPHAEFLNTYFSKEKLCSETQECLFLAARNILYHNYVEKSLKKYDFTFIDRSLDSSVVYQGHVFNPSRVEHIRKENMIAIQGVVPDITLFLDIPVQEIYKRLQNTSRGTYNDFFDGQKREFHEKVRQGYHKETEFYASLPKHNPQNERIKKINADKSEQEVHTEIINTIKKRFQI